MKFKTSIHEVVKNYQMIFHKDPCIRTPTRGVNVRARILSRRNARAHVYASCGRAYARIFMKNHLINLYYLMNKSLKFHKDRSFRSGDICKTILTFVWSLIFYVFCLFSKYEHQSYAQFWKIWEMPQNFCKYKFKMYMYKGDFAICERYESGPGAVHSP